MTTFLLGIVLGSLICTGLPLIIGGFVWRAYRSVPRVIAREALQPSMERLQDKRGPLDALLVQRGVLAKKSGSSSRLSVGSRRKTTIQLENARGARAVLAIGVVRSGPQFEAGILAALHDGALWIEHRGDRFLFYKNDKPIGSVIFPTDVHPNLAAQQSAEILDASDRVILRHDRPTDAPGSAGPGFNGSNGGNGRAVLHGEGLIYHLYVAETEPVARIVLEKRNADRSTSLDGRVELLNDSISADMTHLILGWLLVELLVLH